MYDSSTGLGKTGLTNLTVTAYYCRRCKADVFLTNGVAAMPMRCEHCKAGLWRLEGSIEEIEEHAGIPFEQWTDVTK